MKLPQSLIIMDIHWKIIMKKRIGRGGIMGQCIPDVLEIHILEGLNEIDLVSTIIHEVLHAVEYGLQRSISHSLIYKLEAPLASLFHQLKTPIRQKNRSQKRVKRS